MTVAGDAISADWVGDKETHLGQRFELFWDKLLEFINILKYLSQLWGIEVGRWWLRVEVDSSRTFSTEGDCEFN